MKFNFALCILFFSLYSCTGEESDQEISLRYFYSDGKQITDSTTIRMLAEKVDSLKNTNKFEGERNVYTTLKSGPNLDGLIDSLRSIYIESIQRENPDEVRLLNSQDLTTIFDVGIVIYDNKSGRTIYRIEPENPHNFLSNFMSLGRARRFLGFLMAMDKEYGIDDEFQAYQRQEDTTFISDSNGKIVYSYYRDGKKSLKNLFYYEPGGGTPAYPYEKYTEAEWLNFEHKLKIDLVVYPPYSSQGCSIENTFIDLVELFMLLRNKGVKKTTSIISKITSETGKIIYQNKAYSEKVLSLETSDEMIQLLENNMVAGNGLFIKEQLHLQDSSYVYRGRNLSDLGWLLYSDNVKTIGIIVKGRDRIIHKNRSYSIQAEHKLRNPRIILPILKVLLSSFE